MPCLIFRTLARAEIPAVQPWGYWISYFAGVAIVWALAMPRGRRFFDVGGTEAVVAGFAAGQANTVLVGIPMILKAYGEEGAVPLFLLIAIHLPVTMAPARCWPKDARPRRSAGSPSACFSTRSSWHCSPVSVGRLAAARCPRRSGRSSISSPAPRCRARLSPWASPCAVTAWVRAGACRR